MAKLSKLQIGGIIAGIASLVGLGVWYHQTHKTGAMINTGSAQPTGALPTIYAKN